MASIAALALLTMAGTAQAATSTVCPEGTPTCDFATIQGAVDAASSGDTINVAAGTYTENVNVNKQLTILGAQSGVDARTRPGTGESIVQSGAATTNVPVFSVQADGVAIDGFTVQGANNSSGIALAAPFSGNQVLNNIIQNNTFGLLLNSNGATQTIVRQNFFKTNNVVGAANGNAIHSDAGLSNALIDNNRSTGHDSAFAVFAGAQSNLTISNNELVTDNSIVLFNTTTASITNNISTDPQGSGVFLGGGNNGVDVAGNTISGGVSSAVRVLDVGFGPNTNVSVLSNTLTGNDYGIRISAGALVGSMSVNFNRIVDNTTAGLRNDASVQANAENNWWGCNGGPGSQGCDTVSGTVDFDPWLVLRASANPRIIQLGGDTSEISADLRRNSDGQVAGQAFPDSTPISFATDLGTIPAEGSTTGGVATQTLTSGSEEGRANVTATLDGQSANATVLITPCTIIGTGGDDTLSGTAGRDMICGFGGVDVIEGLGGNDTLLGGSGNDNLKGDDGNDELRGAGGEDTLRGAAGKDDLFGGDDGDQLHTRDGVKGNDLAKGGSGPDDCVADKGDRTVSCSRR